MGIPLFLLKVVLHSGGRMKLRVFEPRYMDMVKACLRTNTPFGVCLLAQGREVAAPESGVRVLPQVPHRVGTLARIADWDMPQLGILNIVAHGGQPGDLLRSSIICATTIILSICRTTL